MNERKIELFGKCLNCGKEYKIDFHPYGLLPCKRCGTIIKTWSSKKYE